jgi:hypothetical protein
MRNAEYVLSVVLALLVLSGMVVWTQANQSRLSTALSCRPGHSAAPVMLKGMSVYPRCPGAKRG